MESTETEAKPKPFDIKDMTNELIDKTTIGTPMPAQIDKFNFNKYIIVNPTPKSKRILNNCTVRYFCQSYFFDQNSKKFQIFDKNYKNVKKDKLSNMSQDKRWIRYCLLLMSEGEQTIFSIDKNIAEDYYKKQMEHFFERKKKDKEKELKQIEREKIKEKFLKEKEELAKKGELKEEKKEEKEKPQAPKPKQELKIDMNIVNDVPNHYKLEDKIYYRIYTEDVYIEKPPFPNKAKDLDEYVKVFNSEIKRLIQKEEKKEKDKREYNLAENWCNEFINKVVNMNKGNFKDEYESEKFRTKRKEIENEMKKPILNLMYIYSKKMEYNDEMARQAIKLAETVYYNKFKGQYDDYFLKISGRYISCLVKLNDFSKAKKILDIVKNKCSKLKEAEQLLKDLENNLNEAEKKKNNENIAKSKAKIKVGLDDSKPNYDWQQGQNEDELNDALNKDINQVKTNMDLIDSNQ